MGNRVNIYRLINPIDNSTFYVGATCNSINGRLNSHIAESKVNKNPKCLFIQELLKIGVRPSIELIENVQRCKANKAENKYINLYKKQGHKLLNSCWSNMPI